MYAYGVSFVCFTLRNHPLTCAYAATCTYGVLLCDVRVSMVCLLCAVRAPTLCLLYHVCVKGVSFALHVYACGMSVE